MTMSRMVVTTSAGSLISGMNEALDVVMCRPRGDSAANCCCRATYVAACAGDVVSPAVLLLLTTVRGTSGNGGCLRDLGRGLREEPLLGIPARRPGRQANAGPRHRPGDEPENPFQHIVIGVVRREQDNPGHLLREPPRVKIHV